MRNGSVSWPWTAMLVVTAGSRAGIPFQPGDPGTEAGVHAEPEA